MIRVCMNCEKPKRYPGCHAQCPEFLAEKEEYDRVKATEYAKRHLRGMLIEQRKQAVDRANKLRRR